MSSERPTRDEITEGMMVKVQQEQENNESDPIIGEVRHVLTDERTTPKGVRVKLESGVEGHVTEIHPDEA